jgi:hypothetical protein
MRGYAMRRHLLNVLTALSLMLAISTAVLWIVSYSEVERVRYQPLVDARASSSWSINGRPSEVSLQLRVTPGWVEGWWGEMPSGLHLAGGEPVDGGGTDWRWKVPGFGAEKFHANAIRRDGSRVLYIQGYSFWFRIAWIAAVSILLPLWRTLYFLHRRVRPKAGLCPHCAYDLRATPDRCPECGTVAPAAGARPP